jgi:hypothetical protein
MAGQHRVGRPFALAIRESRSSQKAAMNGAQSLDRQINLSELGPVLFVDHACFHHELHILQHANIIERILLDCDDVGPFTGLECACFR